MRLSVAALACSASPMRDGHHPSWANWSHCQCAYASPPVALPADLPPPLPLQCLRRDEAYSGCLHGILEAAVEDIDASVVNAQQAGLQIGQSLPRGGERISLTVRRVLHTYSLGLRL